MSLSGVGIGLRRPHFDALADTQRQIDWLEVIAENYVGVDGSARRILDVCRERWPVAPHGVSASLGGPTPLDESWARACGALTRLLDAPFYTEHACWSALDGWYSHDLLPLPFNEAAAEHLGRRARAFAQYAERPLLLENVTYYATMPGSRWSEGQFLSHALAVADAGLLLDVNNVYVNAVNHDEDPLAVLEALPLSRVRQIHVAGHRREGDLLLDDHGSAVSAPVVALLEAAILRVGAVPVLLEWDHGVPPLDVLLDEADRLRAIVDAALSTRALATQPLIANAPHGTTRDA